MVRRSRTADLPLTRTLHPGEGALDGNHGTKRSNVAWARSRQQRGVAGRPALPRRAGKPGGWVGFEAWDSKASQESFIAERLATALVEGGVSGPPSRAEWLDLAAWRLPGA